jgi:hypothetical protein
MRKLNWKAMAPMEIIDLWRDETGATIQELAIRAGISVATVYRIRSEQYRTRRHPINSKRLPPPYRQSVQRISRGTPSSPLTSDQRFQNSVRMSPEEAAI